MDPHATASPRPSRRALLVAGLAVPVAGCGSSPRLAPLRIMVPTPPGGGFDQTARTVASALEESGSHPDVTVFNLPGGRGTAALSRLLYARGSPDLLLQMGLGLVANTHVGTAGARVTEATAVARLIEEPEALLVRSDSDLRSMADLVRRWRSDPGTVRIGGGSTPGGPDHLVTVLLAEELGIAPDDVDYHSYDGGGPMQAALLRDEVDFVAAGPSEMRAAIESGQLRTLAVTSAESDSRLEAPTLRETGVDLEFLNWRGLLAPPGLTADERRRLVGLLEEMHASSEWSEQLVRNGWADAFLTGSAFADFLTEEDERTARALERLGLA